MFLTHNNLQMNIKAGSWFYEILPLRNLRNRLALFKWKKWKKRPEFGSSVCFHLVESLCVGTKIKFFMKSKSTVSDVIFVRTVSACAWCLHVTGLGMCSMPRPPRSHCRLSRREGFSNQDLVCTLIYGMLLEGF